LLSHATAINSNPRAWSSSGSSFQIGRHSRQLHHEAQRSKNTFEPRCSDGRCVGPSKSGTTPPARLLPSPRLRTEVRGGPVHVHCDRLLDQACEFRQVDASEDSKLVSP